MKKPHEQEWHVCDLDHRVVENADDMVVADVRVPPHDGGADAARLIAAAPAMARALLAFMSDHKHTPDCGYSGYSDHQCSSECAGARDALRKAGVL